MDLLLLLLFGNDDDHEDFEKLLNFYIVIGVLKIHQKYAYGIYAFYR